MSSKLEIPWTVDHFRVTAFSQEPKPQYSERWWLDIVGKEPEQRTQRPTAGESTEVGPFLGAALEVRGGLGRADLILRVPDPNEARGTYPVLGKYHEFAEAFFPIAENWLNNIGFPVIRLALGSNLVIETADRESSYANLSRMLPMVQIDPATMRDFTMQINLAQACKTAPGLEINRVFRPSSLRATRLMFETHQSSVGHNYTRLEMDLNTTAENTEPLPEPLETLKELRGHLEAAYSEGVR